MAKKLNDDSGLRSDTVVDTLRARRLAKSLFMSNRGGSAARKRSEGARFVGQAVAAQPGSCPARPAVAGSPRSGLPPSSPSTSRDMYSGDRVLRATSKYSAGTT